MDALTPATLVAPALANESTRALLVRLWREHLTRHRGQLTLILLFTAVMAGTTALYPVLIDHAFRMFENRDRRILYQIPVLVLAVTSVKAVSQYLQNTEVQRLVLLVIRELQCRMFSHLVKADLARL
ncbi:MAG: ABC transporter permease, partial [Acetobacteraceae bacterium]|nr:ABC transporter permease [Acetobacteraceae bacterium]